MAMITCMFVNQPELKCWEWTDDFYMTVGSIADYQVVSHTESVGFLASPPVDCRDALPVASPCLAIKNDVEPNIEEHKTMGRTDSLITQG
ncbi:hypothetical protein Peur_073143 [Populus x canadensis]